MNEARLSERKEKTTTNTAASIFDGLLATRHFIIKHCLFGRKLLRTLAVGSQMEKPIRVFFLRITISNVMCVSRLLGPLELNDISVISAAAEDTGIKAVV